MPLMPLCWIRLLYIYIYIYIFLILVYISKLYAYSVATGKVIENGELLSSAITTSIDLLECVQWQLEWSTYKQTLRPGKPPADYNISLILRCIPKAEVTDEAGDNYYIGSYWIDTLFWGAQ